MRTTGAFLLALLAVSVVPASAAANKEHLQLMAEIRMLQEQTQQLQALMGTLQDTLKTVSTKLDDQSAATRKAMADQTLAVTNMGENVRVLREKADDTNVRISSVAQEIDALRQAISSQPAAQVPTSAPVGSEPVGGSTGASTPTPVTTPPPVGVSPQRMFDASYADFSSSRYELAIQGFQSFIQAFPKSPNAALAQYNIGMSYYNQNKWNEAREAFQKVIADYPQDAQTNAEAYFKLGQTYEHVNQIDNAKKAYETVVQKYPSAFQATLARQALERLNRREE
jgi:tol-pal system protein YbgF